MMKPAFWRHTLNDSSDNNSINLFGNSSIHRIYSERGKTIIGIASKNLIFIPETIYSALCSIAKSFIPDANELCYELTVPVRVDQITAEGRYFLTNDKLIFDSTLRFTVDNIDFPKYEFLYLSFPEWEYTDEITYGDLDVLPVKSPFGFTSYNAGSIRPTVRKGTFYKKNHINRNMYLKKINKQRNMTNRCNIFN